MARIQIDLREDLETQTLVVVLGGTVYRYRMTYNARTDSYTIDILNDANVVLIQGAHCVANWNPFRHTLVENLPEGRTLIIDHAGLGATPGENDIGFNKEAGLYYES
jgi:hypothetical protein